MSFVDNKKYLNRTFSKICEVSWPRLQKIGTFKYQEQIALDHEMAAQAKIDKRKRNQKGEYSLAVKKTEAAELESIVWYREQRLKVASMIAQLECENKQVPIEVREAEQTAFLLAERMKEDAETLLGKRSRPV